MEHGSDMVVVHDLEGNRRFVSPSAARLRGRLATELVGTRAYEHLPPDIVATLRAVTAACVRRPDEAQMVTVRIHYPSSGWYTLEFVEMNMVDIPGIEGIAFTSRDATEREESAAALRASQ